MADTTRGQGRILAVLKLRDGISTKDLSYLLGVRVSSLNELLAKMEKAEYVTRELSEQDKRIMLVKLTEKGRSEEQPDAQDPEDIFSCLTEEEQETMEALLDKIIAVLHENVSEDDEKMFAQMEALRERFRDMPDAPFGDMPPRPPFGGPGPGHGPGHPGRHRGPGFDPKFHRDFGPGDFGDWDEDGDDR